MAFKQIIIDKLCYTELVYKRINKKLKLDLSKTKLEELIFNLIQETAEEHFQKTGKNIYITNSAKNVRLTINSFTNRIITVDRLSKTN